MNFCGIICEFNPFHNGHKFLIDEVKNQGFEPVCLMSGDFVQRGSAAITDKYSRAKIAIKNGASVVLELPTIFACSNAENFASGAVKILTAANVSHLAFGIEKTSLEILQKIAELKAENSERFQNAFKNEIQNGINYNTALKRSIASTLEDNRILEILEKPNNVLAVEYLTAIIKQKSKIIPIAIERSDNGFESNIPNGNFVSASSIRDMILNDKDYTNFIPKNANLDQIFDKNHQKTLECMQILKIKQSSPSELERLYDYSEGIEFRVKEMCEKHATLNDIITNISTPRYRVKRVSKLLLYPILEITKNVVNQSFKTKPVAKVLGIKNKEFLRLIDKKKISLIVTNKDYENLSKSQKQIIEIDLTASAIYNTILEHPEKADKKIGTMFL